MNFHFVAVSAVLVSFLAVTHSGVVDGPFDRVEPYSIIDPIIKAILEKMRPKLANLVINDINKSVNNPSLNATVIIKDMLIRNADKFVIETLKSNIVPLKLVNLTLTWDDITASASYDVEASIDASQGSPIKLFGLGKAKAILNDIFLTIGANVEMKDKVIQIKPRGLFGFDLRIKRAKVTVSSLMGSSELGEAVGTFASKILPDLIDVFKKPVFEVFQDDIIRIVNQVLKKNGTIFLEDEDQMPLLEFPAESFQRLDLSEEIDTFLGQHFDLESEDTESESEF